MNKEVRLMPKNKVIHYSKPMTKTDARTHILTYEKGQSLKDLVNILRSTPSHIKGKGNGSFNIVGCE